jgi:hypothetical protein
MLEETINLNTVVSMQSIIKVDIDSGVPNVCPCVILFYEALTSDSTKFLYENTSSTLRLRNDRCILHLRWPKMATLLL